MDLLCLMFESDERGVLASNGQAWKESDIIEAFGKQNETSTFLVELTSKGVLSRRENDGAYYSRRMVRDQHIRKVRAECGALGGRPKKQNESKTKANTNQNTEYEYETEDTLAVSRGGEGGEELWAAVAAEWSLKGAALDEASARFAEIDAKPSEIPVRRKLLREAWGAGRDTPKSLAKYWGTFPPQEEPGAEWLRKFGGGQP